MDPRDKRPWTVPDLADMRFEDYKAGIAASMHIILNYHSTESIEETIKNYIAAGKNEEPVAAGKKYLGNPLWRYCKNELEEMLSDIGGVLAMRGKLDEGITSSCVAMKVFPNPTNAYNNYGDYLYNIGKNGEAVKIY